MVTLALFDPKDADRLFALFRDWEREHQFDRAEFTASLARLAPAATKLVVAKDGDELVGYAQLDRRADLGFPEHYEIVQLLVAEVRRGEGIGTMLMREAERIAAAEDVGIVKLSSRIQRSKAHVFYENLGYELAKVSKFYQKRLGG